VGLAFPFLFFFFFFFEVNEIFMRIKRARIRALFVHFA